MVSNVTSYSGNGLRDWLAQRLSAVVMVAYVVLLAVYFAMHPVAEQTSWQQLFGHVWMKIITVIVLLNLVVHAWIGIWTIFTDYIKPMWLRVCLELAVILVLAGYLVWGIDIFSSV